MPDFISKILLYLVEEVREEEEEINGTDSEEDGLLYFYRIYLLSIENRQMLVKEISNCYFLILFYFHCASRNILIVDELLFL